MDRYDYSEPLAILQRRKEQLLKEVETVSQAIALLQQHSTGGSWVAATLAAMEDIPEVSHEELAPIAQSNSGRFSNISMRWACLWILHDYSGRGLTTGEIADILIKGGRETKAYSFNSTVSAVLSNMKLSKEVDQVGPYWRLTPMGVTAWQAISSKLNKSLDNR